MPRLPDNIPLTSNRGLQLSALTHINALDTIEKEVIYQGLIPLRLLQLLGIPSEGRSEEHTSELQSQ